MRVRKLGSPALVLFLLASGAVACREAEDAGKTAELETVDVSAQPDALVDPSEDPVERRSKESTGLAGVLPSDFPSGMPAPEGASVVDLEDRNVAFLVPRSPSAVRDAYETRLRSAGWSLAGEGRWARGGAEVGVTFRPEGPSTRIDVSY